MAGLAQLYLAHRPGKGSPAGLEESLAELWRNGRAAWPTIPLSPEALVRHLAERCTTLPDPALRAGDVYLACACAAGVPEALAAFAAGFLDQVPAYLARTGTPRDLGQEVRQHLGELLLVGDPGKIADYQGRGALAGWVRAAATRLAINAARGDRRHRRAVEAAAVESCFIADSPELDFIKASFRPQFKKALRAAVATLSARDRVILRLHYRERMGIAEIARSYGVHRATLSRWLHEAQVSILEVTRRLLREELKVGAVECDHLVGMVQSRLDVTLSSLLRSASTTSD